MKIDTSIQALRDGVDQLIGWFKSHVKPFLESVQPEKVAALDSDTRNLENVTSSSHQEFSVCFLGNAGVGKSTLINSLVAGKDVILPAGGIGPLTAQAKHDRDSTIPNPCS